ncbi:MAG: hypothetical protein K2W85_02255 [Phycisphaerales bacterium]|nr:hypothetical protein [Phycisphaerales bacterium]
MSSKPFRKFAPAVLVVAGVVAGAFVSEMIRATPALAQQDGKLLPPGEALNAGEQRRQQTVLLQQLSDRLTRIESTLAAGIKVKVTEMPPVIMKDPVSGK